MLFLLIWKQDCVMAQIEKETIQQSCDKASSRYYIKITSDGPYLVYGLPSIDQEVIMPDEDGASWVYRRGKHFETKEEPVALCRCGASRNKPFCDGKHRTHRWDSRETASREPLLENAETYEGETMILSDNRKYCAFARFCDAKGQIWNLVESAETDEERRLVERESGHCPAGRLIVRDRETGQPYEPAFAPSIGIIEDPEIKVSGPIWVKGGIRIESSDGTGYEIRNRVTLCRCGVSENKPFCDGTHASMKFHDGLTIDWQDKEW